MQETIQQLCQEYTDLTAEEIQIIQMMALTLQPLANLESADMFIDCPCVGSRDAIVVAEAKPEEGVSSYKGSVVGMLAKAENEPAVARTHELGIATKHMKARTQEDNYTIQCVEPIKYNQRVIGVLIRERRITDGYEPEPEDRCQAVETPLSHMLNERAWLTESIDEGLILVDKRGIVSFRNMYARELFQGMGYVEDILGQKYKNICLLPCGTAIDEFDEMLTEVKAGGYSLRIRQIPIHEGDIRLAVIIRDVTWLREQEKNLMLKSVAIRELHHRIKNNLQTIASLLRLQARRTKSEETKRLLMESISRILSISVTHQLLASSGLEGVSLKEVLGLVKNNAIQPFLRPNLKLELSLEGDDVIVDSDIASSVALAVNELLQNSMKYAFEGRESGKIRIVLEKGKVYSRILVLDDGIGFQNPERQEEKLGLNIVESVVREKLHGNLKINWDEEGTKASFDFINETPDLISLTE